MSQLTAFLIDVAAGNSPLATRETTTQCLSYLEYTLLNKAHAQRKTDYVQVALANLSSNDPDRDPALPVNMAMLAGPQPRPLISVKDVGEWVGRVSRHLERPRNPRNPKDEQDEETDVSSSLFNALLVLVLQLKEFVGKRKMRVRIVVFTGDTFQDVSSDELETFDQQCPFEVVLVSPSALPSALPKAETNDSGAKALSKAVSLSHGLLFSTQQMISAIADPRPKLVRPVRIFEGQLRLGDPQLPESLCINVEAYPGTKQVSLESRRVLHRVGEQGLYEYKPVKSVVEYYTGPNSDDTGATISSQYVSKAHRYGSDYVSLPQMLEEKRQFHASPGIDIRGFLDMDKLERRYLCSESVYVVAGSTSRADYVGFCSLVDALAKQRRTVLARWVPKSGSEAQMCVLAPARGSNGERVLVMSRLAMAEEERGFSGAAASSEAAASDEAAGSDLLMERFVEGMTMQGGSSSSPGSSPGPGIIQRYADMAVDTGVPLPMDQTSGKSGQKSGGQNPGQGFDLPPAIPLHLQRWAILHKVHTNYISQYLGLAPGIEPGLEPGSDSTLLSHRTPPMSPAVTRTFTPHHGPLELSHQLKSHLGVEKQPERRPTESPDTPSTPQDPELLDLEALLGGA
ncbi:ATP-dependent DNA helicase II subunit 2 [Kluyveromyces marxianus DMKU3-1042]|uniref:DNA helicase n=1 Tax=Kluyveromyces marxianus (strain DMKU3-1042 / BCC 29191 / NBRC 104275) TaxID=1003335 RepID=W0T7L6_KLUMD|nr:ATP-dependent DNA helicase II subunit 2 [Kluyveromyces marxianus DMKU3-1042]BAO39395.1 ATP-dependent DNA helicase II subunit 2 [Kluyveromyces marxianus DMKU3-1042]